jgi:hypothetical protein
MSGAIKSVVTILIGIIAMATGLFWGAILLILNKAFEPSDLGRMVAAFAICIAAFSVGTFLAGYGFAQLLKSYATKLDSN